MSDNIELKRLTLTTSGVTMVMEFDTVNLMTEWMFALKECIRVSNCNSLIKGQRIPAVVAWYEEQYSQYSDAVSVIRSGNMFCLHHIDSRDGFVELIPIWLMQSQSGLGFVMLCNNVTYNSTGPPKHRGADESAPQTAARSRIEGLEIPYHSITTIMTGSKIEVYHTPEMGGTAR